MKYKIVIIKGLERKLIKEDGIWVYLKHRCKHCGQRIPFKESNKQNGIPKFIFGHGGFGKHWSLSEETRLRYSKIKKKYCKEHPEFMINLNKASMKCWEDNPDKKIKHMKMMHKTSGKKINTSIELIIQEHVKTLTDKPFETNYLIQDYENNKIYFVDILIPHIKTVIEVNGCYVHKCIDCHPLQDDILKAAQRRIDDNEKIDFLRKYGFNVVVIWEHDIKNGKYKKILKQLLI